MTAISDIDLASMTKKFMPDDRTNEGIINTIAQALLLNPQIALSFILRAKNNLQQLVTKEIGFMNDMLSALNYINGYDAPITDDSDLVNAQTALIELDRTGNVNNQSFTNYQNAIDHFLSTALSKVRSGSKDQFAISATEAKEDLFIGLAGLSLYHPQIQDLIRSIVGSVENFRTIDLSKRVSRNIISNVRTSVSDTKESLNDSSKVGVAIELLSGLAMVNSIIGKIDILDPIIKTGTNPLNTNIKGMSELVPATAISSPFPITSSQKIFGVRVNGGSLQSVEYPATGVNNHIFIVSNLTQPTYIIPPNYKLYIKVEVQSPLKRPQDVPTSDAGTIWIPLTSGTRTLAQIKTEIDDGLQTLDITSSDTRYGHCTEFAINGSNCLLIYGVDNVTSIQVMNNIRGQILPPYVEPYPSAHEILGFTASQTNDPVGLINLNTFTRFCNLALTNVIAKAKDNQLIISSTNQTSSSSLKFNTGLATDLGFTPNVSIGPIPGFIVLQDNGTLVDASLLDIHPGYRVVQGSNSYTVQTVSGNEIGVSPQLIAFPLSDISIFSDVENIITPLIRDLSSQDIFSVDINNMKSVLNPLISSTPTNAQVGDARRTINGILTRLNNLLNVLSTYTLQTSLSNAEEIAKEILYTLETHNLNNAKTLLLTCKFTQFFEQDINQASTGLNMISSIEGTGQQIAGGP